MVLAQIAEHPADRIGDLLPWNLAGPTALDSIAAPYLREFRSLAAWPAPARTCPRAICADTHLRPPAQRGVNPVLGWRLQPNYMV